MGMSLRSTIAITAGEAARWASRTLLHRSGGNIPGAVALRVNPNLLASFASLFAQGGSIVVTGTNGKTTTTNLLADCLAASGRPVVTNRAGNNMEGGITAAAMEGRRTLTRAQRAAGEAIGCFECDELYTVRVLPKLRPRYLVLLNLFRDQLDRYGEIDHTQDVIARALELSPETTLIFNADDPLCASIARRVSNPTIAFGLDEPTGTESDKVSDSRFCAVCNAPLDYAYVQYGQLGKYRCPACGWERPALSVAVRGISLSDRGYTFRIEQGPAATAEPAVATDPVAGAEPAVATEPAAGEKKDNSYGSHQASASPAASVAPAPAAQPLPVHTAYRGLYMVYNITAAFTAARLMGAPEAEFPRVLAAYKPARGRMQTFTVGGRPVLANLAKNPVGFDRMLQLVKNSAGRACAFYINDNDADGHDISWLWDADFECLAGIPGLQVFAGGTRANDLQVRLKYAGVKSTIALTVSEALAACTLPADEMLYVVGNYTAMPALCDELEKLDEGDAAAMTAEEAIAAADAAAAKEKAREAAQAAAGSGSPAAADGDAVAAGSPVPDRTGAARSADEREPWALFSPGEVAPGFEALATRPLRICHLYPEEMNLYGDTGNVQMLYTRCLWRGIPVEVTSLNRGERADLAGTDIAMIGGGADRDQLAVQGELLKNAEELRAYINAGGVLLAICGGYQLLGRHYYLGDDKIEGIAAVGIETARAGGPKDRLIGNVSVRSEIVADPILGFENHGGRTYLDADEQPLGMSVVPGTGNNGEDGFEGLVHDGVVGTYFHGPVLSKNPQLADWLIARALRRRGVTAPLAELDDAEERGAREAFEKKLPR